LPVVGGAGVTRAVVTRAGIFFIPVLEPLEAILKFFPT
jgi:hypothetical protein